MVVLVPNAMYWNNNWQTYPLWDEIAERQLQWLAEQLALAKKQGQKSSNNEPHTTWVSFCHCLAVVTVEN